LFSIEGPEHMPAPHWPSTRVRCGTVWHQVQVSGGTLNLLDHTDAEIAREFTFGGLGGVMSGCAQVRHVWHTALGRLPRDLRRQRIDFYAHAHAGRTDEVVALLDAGFDVHAVDGSGATLMHHLAVLDHTRLWDRLRAAGLPLDGLDKDGRTPLIHAARVINNDLMTLLLDHGADASVTDLSGCTAGDWLHRRINPGYGYRGPSAADSPLLARLQPWTSF
jgi:hypothetical protein